MDNPQEGRPEESNVVPLFKDGGAMPPPVDASEGEAHDIAFGLSPEAIQRLMGHVYGGDTWEKELDERRVDDDMNDREPEPPISIFRRNEKPPEA